MRWIVFPNDAAQVQDLGGKARALLSLSAEEFPIPPWFVLRGEACLQSLGESARRQLAETSDPHAIQRLFDKVAPDEMVQSEIRGALSKLGGQGTSVAVRSSASDEDGTQHSFAGQLDSFLFVPATAIAQRIGAVWRSGFAERILSYRRQHGLSLVPRPPAVLIQRMVNAEAAGVAFSADPVSGRRGVATVSAVFGLGSALVSGEANADTWLVERNGQVLERHVVEKTVLHVPDPASPEGVLAAALSAGRAVLPVLNDEQVQAVAALARRCAAHFGRPQDIEWAFESGRLFLLQSRPITSLAGRADPDGALNIWDNSNIAESYGGVTTPLTFSFARRAYEEVYRQFCRLMVVPSSRIANNSQVFACMLGLVQGRVYYNLLNWYRLLAMLPGYQVNRRFMEQMMGVKDPLPESLVASLQTASAAERFKDALNMAVTVAGLLVNHFTLSRRIRGFYERLNRALERPNPPLEQARPDELAGYYRELERQLLRRWDAPLVNDFFAMIFYGVLRKLCAKWCGDADGTLQNNLICGEGQMISAEPARRVRELASLAARHDGLPAQLCTAPLEQIRRQVRAVPEFATACEKYLEQFGDRCLDELKLESATLFDDPTLLFRSIGQLALNGSGHTATHSPDAGIEKRLRAEGEARAERALGGHLLRRVVFRWVLKHARGRVRDRENLRFERTRLFGRVRRIFVAMGREFHARDLLESPADIFYLEVDEILGFCDATTTTTDLKGLVKLRRAEYTRFVQSEPPADRFETRGPVHHGQTYRAQAAGPDSGPGDQWKGLGCCPGVVTGSVRLIRDPRQATLKPGEILVAERTDPGWIMLFSSAAGLVVERGSLLSHSAIVSREMGIPSVVSIPGITKRLKDGDRVELNGSTGIVRRLAPG